MRNLDCLSAKQLLSINAPESLFSYSASEARREYRALALHWHPDRSTHPESVPVFTHIVLLFRQAQAKLENGLWDEPVEKAESEKQGIKKFRLRQGTLKTIDYLYLQPFELGTMYIAANHVTFRIDQEFSDLYDNARKQIHGLRFQNESMCLEMASYLPQILDVFETKSASFLQLRKTPDQLLLSQVLGQFLKGIEPIEHIGWIMNVLFHIGCYLEWQGIAHNAISPETFFISPLRHSGMLLGGWWYTARKGDSLRALSDPVMQIIPDDIIRRNQADTRADLELIKATGRRLLGDTPAGFTDGWSVRSRLSQWLNEPATGNAALNYRQWKYGILEECFGKPKFVQMHLASTDLYKEV